MTKPLTSSGFLSPEFWVALAALAAKLVALFFVIRSVSLTDPNSQGAITQAVVAVIAGIGALFTINQGASNYVNKQMGLKAEMFRAAMMRATVVNQRHVPSTPATTIDLRPRR